MNDLSTADLRVDPERIKRDILELAEIGRDPESRGIYRMGFTEADMRGKRWLVDRIEAAGLMSSIDGAGNVIGQLSPAQDAASNGLIGDQPQTAQSRTGQSSGGRPAIVIGSHIDTVPCAGALDGTLGVVVGLECLRRLHEAGIEPSTAVDLIAFSDEEGRFGGMFGSESFSGRMTPERIQSATDLDGVRLWDAMTSVGLDPMAALDAQRDPAELRCYIELHIEQGPVLDRMRVPVGIVDDITGLFKWSVSFRGEANHAGTTPMDMRHDAFMGLADFAHEIPRIVEENGSELTRATIGRAQILPGSANTVPGRVEFSLDVRDTSEESLVELSSACRKALSAIARRRNLMFEFQQQSWIKPVACDKEIIAQLVDAAESLGLPYQHMPSGAAHDAQIVSGIAPIAMLFVPSRDGQSHSPAEWTSWQDIEAGANLLLQTLLRLTALDIPTSSSPNQVSRT